MKKGSIVRSTLTQQTTERLRRDILLGVFPAGSRVTAQAVAERYSISQLPVREAMQILSGEYLLTLNPYRGATLTVIDWQFICNMYDVLRSMEVLLLESITDHWTPQLRSEVLSINEQIAQLAQQETGQTHARSDKAFNKLNRLFHSKLEQFCQNPQAIDLRNQYHRNITILMDGGAPHSLSRYRTVAQEHSAIIAAVDSGDMDEIRKEYTRHSMNAQQELYRILYP